MTQAFRYLSSTDGYLPMVSKYVVAFIRNPSMFPYVRYAQMVEAPAPSFTYPEIDRDQIIRTRNPAKFLWAKGAKRAQQHDNQFPFRLLQGFTQRYDFGSTIDDEAMDLAKTWNAKAVYVTSLATQAMTTRVVNCWRGMDGLGTGTTGLWTGLDNTNTWPSTNTADVNTLNGNAGPWTTASSDPADNAYMAIRKSIQAAVNRIHLNTNGVVNASMLRLVINPDLAVAMSNTSEIRDAYKYGPMAKQYLEGPGSGKEIDDRWSLPQRYAGVEIVVEDSMFLNDPPTASNTTADTSRTYIKSPLTACIISRQGAIDADVGPAFSTFQTYWWKDQLATEQFRDPRNRVVDYNVVDEYTHVPTALVSGFLITGVSG